jgi:dipeptidyl aminopeptidase/acylaminoacyl peptidase
MGYQDNHIIRLDSLRDSGISKDDLLHGDFVVVKSQGSGGVDSFWNKSLRSSIYLVSMKDGSRRLLQKDALRTGISYSPDNNYVLLYDGETGNYYSHQVNSGTTRNISSTVPYPLDAHKELFNKQYPVGTAGWSKDSRYVFVYDRYDIWRLDSDGAVPPLNVTRYYGRKHGISLRFLSAPEIGAVLYAFNETTKENGFFKLKTLSGSTPVKLSMEKSLIYYPQAEYYHSYNSFKPILSRNGQVYLVMKGSASEYPNLFTSTNLMVFKQQTNLQPQLNYNWMVSEPLSWKLNDTLTSQGVLYKPENFDPQKKYPVILFFYEKGSDELHNFLFPEPTDGFLPIPYFVSRGYLVCVPDIHYQRGEAGESAFRSVMSVANALIKNSWVDSTKLGLSGFSFGGFEVNYIVTRTNRFAAAAPGAGIVNFISFYGSISVNGSRQGLQEDGQARMGGSLWDKPDAYLNNSPILYANKVNTPMLIVHNTADGNVPFAQAEEWFLALRRLRKKVWLLQYDGEYHGFTSFKAAADYTIRLEQFFNHYLKNSAQPQWMISGIPARLKGVTNGLSLDFK